MPILKNKKTNNSKGVKNYRLCLWLSRYLSICTEYIINPFSLDRDTTCHASLSIGPGRFITDLDLKMK